MDALDGNAIGGLLHEVFGTDMTAAKHLRDMRREPASGRDSSSTCGPGHRGPLPHLRQRPHGLRQAHDVTCVDLAGLASLGQSDTALREQTGFGDSPGCRTSMQEPRRKGRAMPHEESMSTGAPQEESMSMGKHEESMSTGAPQEESMSMGKHEESMSTGAPQEESMSMGKHEESMSTGAPQEESMSMGKHEESMSTDAPQESM